MKGIAYGVGVGPGDPKLMTLRAIELIRPHQSIFAPTMLHRDTRRDGLQIGSQRDSGASRSQSLHMTIWVNGSHRRIRTAPCQLQIISIAILEIILISRPQSNDRRTDTE